MQKSFSAPAAAEKDMLRSSTSMNSALRWKAGDKGGNTLADLYDRRRCDHHVSDEYTDAFCKPGCRAAHRGDAPGNV